MRASRMVVPALIAGLVAAMGQPVYSARYRLRRIGPAELEGHVVLVNFWTWTCINWLRQEPYVRAWAHAYQDDGLVVVGVNTPEFSFEHDVDGVRRATEERAIEYPVAVKTAVPGILHKTEVRGVRTDVADVEELRETYRDLEERLGPEVTVAAMAPPGIEVALGIVRDATFGPLVLVAAGGVLVELLHDRKLALPPIDEDAARRLIAGLAIRPLLDGVRGAPATDVGALARAVSRLSVLAFELGDLIAELDVNPVIVSPEGCAAVDALVIPAVGGDG